MGCCSSDGAINWEKYADDIADDELNDSLQSLKVKGIRNIKVRNVLDKVIEINDLDFGDITLYGLKQRIQNETGIQPNAQTLCIDQRNKFMNYLRTGNNKYSWPSRLELVKNDVIIIINSDNSEQTLSEIPSIQNLRDGQELLLIMSLPQEIDTIFIKYLDGNDDADNWNTDNWNTLTLSVDESTTIKAVKQKIFEEKGEGFEIQRQRLIFAGAQLKEEYGLSLSDYDIGQEGTLHMVIRQESESGDT